MIKINKEVIFIEKDNDLRIIVIIVNRMYAKSSR